MSKLFIKNVTTARDKARGADRFRVSYYEQHLSRTYAIYGTMFRSAWDNNTLLFSAKCIPDSKHEPWDLGTKHYEDAKAELVRRLKEYIREQEDQYLFDGE